MTERNNKGQFAKGNKANPKGRPRDSKATRALRQAIKDGAADIIESMMKQAIAGDPQAAKLLLDRSLPVLKSEHDRIQLPALAQDDIGKQAQAIIEGAACGDLAPDVAATLVSAITGKARIIELAEIEARIAALEEQDHD